MHSNLAVTVITSLALFFTDGAASPGEATQLTVAALLILLVVRELFAFLKARQSNSPVIESSMTSAELRLLFQQQAEAHRAQTELLLQASAGVKELVQRDRDRLSQAARAGDDT